MEILNHISMLGMKIVNRYYAYCTQVSNVITGYKKNKYKHKMIKDVLKEVNYDVEEKIIISPIKVNLMEAPEVCKSIGTNLWELKNNP